MKYAFYLMALVVVTMTVASCKKKNNPVAVRPVANTEDTLSAADSTVFGVCGEATAMHTLQLITDTGDTLSYMINDEESRGTNVQGGLLVGDRMAVVGTKIDGEMTAQTVINLTTLVGKWTSIDKNFEIEEGGTVKSNVKAESNPWTSWKIFDGKLLLNRDTFNINLLGADSLYLENSKGIYTYKRTK